MQRVKRGFPWLRFPSTEVGPLPRMSFSKSESLPYTPPFSVYEDIVENPSPFGQSLVCWQVAEGIGSAGLNIEDHNWDYSGVTEKTSNQ